MPLPQDYTERVCAGVLGKIIGVYLGRPFEGWTHERVMETLGEVRYYVHEQFGAPLIVTDDDISGTFTFIRAMEDDAPPPGRYSGANPPPTPTPAQIGAAWLNYIIEERTVLWWGGLGNSTEHTAFLRLKTGIEAPRSGSIALNGRVVAEQIGAQIFIDGWGMVAPGDPELAADLARRAASVSHDGIAIHGAQVIAAMEAVAFVERDIGRIIDAAVAQIPADSLIYRMIADIRNWRAAESDWQRTREQIARRYGYDVYGGNCHLAPNHALIIHALLHGDDDFGKTLMIVNTCGWDTDCNSGNAGCIMGIKNGLAGIEAGADYRGPVADRLYLPTADGGRAITDAVTEAYRVANLGRALAGEAPEAPKAGARYHFEMPGSVQGFQPEDSSEVRGTVEIQNVPGHSALGKRSLALNCRGLAPGRIARVATPVFIPSLEVKEYFERRGYGLTASPALYPGQTVCAGVGADERNTGPVSARLYVRAYGPDDQLRTTYGPGAVLLPDSKQVLTWQIPPLDSPIAEVGLECRAVKGGPAAAIIHVDYLTWDGAPDVTFTRPLFAGSMWSAAWVNAVDHYEWQWDEPFRLVQDRGTGLLIQGTREWTNYRVSADVTPHLAAAAGIAARVQGLRRYYALLLTGAVEGLDGGTRVQLVRACDGERVLAEADARWRFGIPYRLTLDAHDASLRAWMDDTLLFDVTDDVPLRSGAVALVITEGRTATQAVRVTPIERA